MYTIYRHVNRANQKCYVGQTKKSVQRRWQAHVKDALNESQLLFHRAIRKYAIDQWSCEILECVETKKEANEREKFWISHFKSNDRSFGYNMTEGGDGGLTSDPEIIGEFFRGKLLSEDHKNKIAKATEEFWSSEEGLEKKVRLAARNQTPEAIQASRDAQLRRWSKPGAREKFKELWATPEFREKMLASRRK